MRKEFPAKKTGPVQPEYIPNAARMSPEAQKATDIFVDKVKTDLMAPAELRKYRMKMLLEDALQRQVFQPDIFGLPQPPPGQPPWTVQEAIAIKLTHAAMFGDVSAIREVFDRIDGKTKLEVDAKMQHSYADFLKMLPDD